MEESKLRTHRRPSVGSGPSPRRGAAGSSHVIDLRAAKSDAPAPSKPKSRAAAKTRRPLAAPNQSKVPVAQTAPPAASDQPAAAPLGPAPAASAPAVDATLPPRRFWPAFWRFLLLLVVLALLVVGGVYLYINYYRG